MKSLWVVSANAGRAMFLSCEGRPAHLQQMGELTNDKASLQTSDTESDRIGQHSASSSVHSVGAPTQPSGYQPNQTPAEHHAEVFARSISRYLLNAYHNGQFMQLALVASPEFLGVLRKVLDSKLLALVAVEINKDYTAFSHKELFAQIQPKVAA